MRYISEEICRENLNKILNFTTFFKRAAYGTKYCRDGQATDKNILHQMNIAC
jgi:hypothetical protein